MQQCDGLVHERAHSQVTAEGTAGGARDAGAVCLLLSELRFDERDDSAARGGARFSVAAAADEIGRLATDDLRRGVAAFA
jgi:hypothetical protein